ncbi:hypothetical protein ETD86_50030 [Nonomuraea turkmeniaca]|uniref:PqqD family protein n=1 Tax=Nonomuraea turkmeniaca TaxID=103838 RepID=A0A5S4EWF6_9ACTN|nr:hypothetical protein [Nonomuraea turkmeniaca]TMR07911.1 hypothetical protein ETD86_50030 [Nonomuraea turkmeniaca]
MNAPAEEAGEPLRLRPLTLTEDGGQVVVGDPATGRFVAMPPVGGVVIRAFQSGATVTEAARAAERYAGESVDVPAFVATLGRLGFLDDPARPVPPPRTGALQLSGWLSGPPQALVRPLFGRVAWILYGTAFVLAVVLLAAFPEVRPSAADAFVLGGAGPELLLFLVLTRVMTALHECWHWLAAVAAGVPARFGVDWRLYFVVFETDLSQLWRLPRRQRYGPLLAGLAFDSVLLAALLGIRLAALAGALSLPATAVALVEMLALAKSVTMLWQFMLFLRTDLYAVLATATGCRNLWRVKTLLLRRALGRLTPAQAAELATANPRDVQVGRWFRWVWLAGLGVGGFWLWWFYLPFMTRTVTGGIEQAAGGPLTAAFWFAILCLVILLWAQIALAVRTLLRIAGFAADRLGHRRNRT